MASYIEGKRPVIEALRAKVPMRRITIGDYVRQDSLVKDIMRKAKQQGIKIVRASRREMDERAAQTAHQGIIAQVAPYNYAGIGEIIDCAQKQAQATNRSALVVVCDHITDAGNLGAICRSANAAGACGLVIPNKRSAHVEASTYKTSAGAVAHMKLAQVSNISQVLMRLKKEGFWVCAATEHAQDEVWDANLKGKIALVLGNEQTGISRLTLEACDFLVKLPLAGAVESLNVAQAGTALMYEWVRQNRQS